MNIYEYMDNYGIYTFEEKPFNEVDSVIFSFLSYADFSQIVEKKKVLLKEVGRIHLGLHNKKEKNIIAVREANKILNYMKDTNRYKNCALYRYVYIGTQEIQFSAISIEYQKNKVYVSYEGTDQLISGWKENLLLGYNFPTETHKKAVEYLNKYYTFDIKSIIVGGHSKGGNLALVAAMGCNALVRAKIKTVYNFDGPGLLQNEIESKNYKRILPKYCHIIPDDSLVGIILNSPKDIVVKSKISGPLAHNIVYWEIENDHLQRNKLSSFSKELRIGLKSYLESHSKEELKIVINNLDKVCQKANVTSLIEFKQDHRKIIDFIKSCSCLDMESRNMLYDLVNVFIKALGDSKHKDFIDFVKRFKLDI